MNRIRGKKQYEVHYDKESGKYRILNGQDEIDLVNDGGGLDSQHVVEVHFLDCKCRASVAGQCDLCGNLSCANCHGHCNQCRIPICPECSIFVDDSNGQSQRWCKRCHDQQRRKRRFSQTVKILLSPFIRFEQSHEK